MRHNNTILATTALSLFLALTVVGCGESDLDNSEQASPPLDLSTSSDSNTPASEVVSAPSDNPIIIHWCSAKSERDETSCKCILTAVKASIDSADYLILSEVAEADLTTGSSEEGIETYFNRKYGADRMLDIMETFVSMRTAAEKTCPSLAGRNQAAGSKT